MTSQHDRRDEKLTGQLPNQSGHCPLTGGYFVPCLGRKPNIPRRNFKVLCVSLISKAVVQISLIPKPRKCWIWHKFSSFVWIQLSRFSTAQRMFMSKLVLIEELQILWVVFSIAYTSSPSFENVPSKICCHMIGKGPKGRGFLRPICPKITRAKVKERKNRKIKEKGRRRREKQ